MENIRDTKDIELMANGDPDAFARLYSFYRDKIYAFAYRMVGDQAKAEDIMQESFLFLIQNPERYDPAKSSLLTFLCVIARNKIISYFRRQGIEVEDLFNEDEASEWIDENGIDPLSLVLSQELSTKINEAIAKLPALQREVIVLREFHDLSYEEISEVVGTQLNVVKARIHRARQNLSKTLAPYLFAKGVHCYELQRS